MNVYEWLWALEYMLSDNGVFAKSLIPFSENHPKEGDPGNVSAKLYQEPRVLDKLGLPYVL